MRWLFEPLSRQTTNRLTTGASVPGQRSVAWLLVLLVVACFIPRAWMAGKLDLVCPDGVLYLELAAAIDRGDMENSLGPLGLNTYPAILALLHGAGLDWQAAGELWGISVASLVVLPLFGWTRRQFDDRVATWACLLYACHPKLIEWSPELIRGPTFWFLWVASIYAIWRAVTELRVFWFAVAGLTIALALHTRFEGWFLFVPLLCWSAWRFWQQTATGWRLASGVAVTAVVCPLLLWTVNVTWLRHNSQWELGNFQRLAYVAQWAEATFPGFLSTPDASEANATNVRQTGIQTAATVEPAGEDPSVKDAHSGQQKSDRDTAPLRAASMPETPVAILALPPWKPPARMSTAEALWSFAHHARRGCGAIFGSLMLAGVFGWFRVWRRCDYQPLFWTALCVMAGIWFHMWYAQATSSRYWLSLVLLACPFAALGLARLAEWMVSGLLRLGIRASYTTMLLVLIGICTAFGWADALSSSDDLGRRGEAALGRWLAERYGAESHLLMPATMPVCRYYFGPSERITSVDSQTYASVEHLATSQPDVAVLSRHKTRADVCRVFIEEAARLGFLPVPSRELPAECNPGDIIVLARGERVASLGEHDRHH